MFDFESEAVSVRLTRIFLAADPNRIAVEAFADVSIHVRSGYKADYTACARGLQNVT